MDGDELRNVVLGFPEVTERETWGHPTFRVRDKILVTLAADGSTATLKAGPGEQAALLAADPDTFSPAVHGGPRGWVLVQLATVDDVRLRELIADAWRIVAPKRLFAEQDSQEGS